MAAPGNMGPQRVSVPALEALEPRLLLNGADLVTAGPVDLDTLGNVQQPIASLSVGFSANVGDALTAEHLLLRNDLAGEDVPADDLALEYEAGTNVATWRVPGLP